MLEKTSVLTDLAERKSAVQEVFKVLKVRLGAA